MQKNNALQNSVLLPDALHVIIDAETLRSLFVNISSIFGISRRTSCILFSQMHTNERNLSHVALNNSVLIGGDAFILRDFSNDRDDLLGWSLRYLPALILPVLEAVSLSVIKINYIQNSFTKNSSKLMAGRWIMCIKGGLGRYFGRLLVDISADYRIVGRYIDR